MESSKSRKPFTPIGLKGKEAVAAIVKESRSLLVEALAFSRKMQSTYSNHQGGIQENTFSSLILLLPSSFLAESKGKPEGRGPLKLSTKASLLGHRTK